MMMIRSSFTITPKILVSEITCEEIPEKVAELQKELKNAESVALCPSFGCF